MATSKKIVRKVETIEVDNPRDFVMARLYSARGSLQAALEALDDAAGAFTNPESDKSGKDRKQLISDALECTGSASRALEAAEGWMSDFEKATWLEREPWDDDEDEDEDDEDDDDDEDEGD